MAQQFEQFAPIARLARDFDTGDLFQNLPHFPAKPAVIVG
jgi:hypothetical protein